MKNDGAPEIPVTEEKREVVRNVLRSHGLSGDSTWDGVVDGIYRAMRAEKPDLDIIDSLQVSQDALLAERQELIAHAKKIGTLMIERDRAIELLRCSENVRYDLAGRVKELEAGIPAVDTSTLLARAEAAERHRKEMFELKEIYRERMVAAETLLADRAASLHRAVRAGGYAGAQARADSLNEEKRKELSRSAHAG